MGLSKLLAVLLALMTAATLAMFLMGDRITRHCLRRGSAAPIHPATSCNAVPANLKPNRRHSPPHANRWRNATKGFKPPSAGSLPMFCPAHARLPLCWQQLRDGASRRPRRSPLTGLLSEAGSRTGRNWPSARSNSGRSRRPRSAP